MIKIHIASLGIECIGPENIKHFSKMLFVFLYRFRVNQNIIHKYQHNLLKCLQNKVFIKIIDVVEGTWGIEKGQESFGLEAPHSDMTKELSP